MSTTETLSVVEGGESQIGEIWTIGHSIRSTEEFLALLHEHAIDSLVDVRSFPGSRRCPQFGASRRTRPLPWSTLVAPRTPCRL